MKVLLLNGSPHVGGCTYVALHEMEKVFLDLGVETDLIHIGNKNIRGCVSCGQCEKLGRCVVNDLVNETAEKFRTAEGLVIGSPVYYGSPNGTALAFMDRLFYSTGFDKTMKVGAAVVSCRRAGNTASFDVLNSILPSAGCRWPPASIGTIYTAFRRRMPSRTPRDSRRCGRWPGT